MATKSRKLTASNIRVDDVPYTFQQSNHHPSVLQLNEQNLALISSVHPLQTYQFNTVRQKWTNKTDDTAIQNGLETNRQTKNILSKVKKSIDDIDETAPHPMVHVKSKNMVLIFYKKRSQQNRDTATVFVGRYNLITDTFESMELFSSRNAIRLQIDEEIVRNIESATLSSDKNRVVFIVYYTSRSRINGYTHRIRCLCVLNIRNANEYSLYSSKVQISGLPSRMIVDCSILGPTDNGQFAEQWISNLFKQQPFKGMDIAVVLVSLIKRYYSDPMLHLIQYFHKDGCNRHHIMPEKAILKRNYPKKISWSSKTGYV